MNKNRLSATRENGIDYESTLEELVSRNEVSVSLFKFMNYNDSGLAQMTIGEYVQRLEAGFVTNIDREIDQELRKLVLELVKRPLVVRGCFA